MEREQLIKTLLQNFLKTLSETLKPFQTLEERVDYLETLMEYLQGVYWHEDAIPELGIEGNPFDSGSFIRKKILLKYKDKAKPFVDTELRCYFEKVEGLKAHLFARLKLTEPILDEHEQEVYMQRLSHILHNLIEKICIQPGDNTMGENEHDLKTLTEGVNGQKGKFKSTSKEYTRHRQIILFHFMLKLIGVTRFNSKLIDMAEFGHVLFAWPTDNAENTAVYRMIKEAPYLKEKEKDNLEDLEFVKMQFERINHIEGIALVQKEIDGLKRQ
jgi:hypothetical protein